MTTATVVRPSSSYHRTEPPEIVAANHMQRRRSLAPAQLATRIPDHPSSNATDPYQLARTATSGNRPASSYTGRSYSQKQQQQQQPQRVASPVNTTQTTAAPAHASEPAQNSTAANTMSTQQPRQSGHQNATSRHDINSRHPGARERREQRIGDFVIKQTLGKGTFSKVCMAEHRTTKQKFALKFIKPKSPQGGSADKHNIRVEREIKLLSLLYHPNIVRLYDVVQTPKFTMIVMEHNSGGELLQYIRKRGRLHENDARGFFRQIVSAMDYTHRNCIIHRDLKLENVMLDSENRIRIIDFGFANTFEWDKQLDTFCGSPFYAAPEMVNGIKYTGPEVDIWSMGVILFFMLCGRTPFEGENLKEIYDKISRGKFSLPPFLSKEAQSLLQMMLTVNPKQRISMKGIVEHPWTNKDCDQPIDNHLPSRPSVVLQPDDYALQKMRIYKYDAEDVKAALAHSDSALTPMVCIYHLVLESRRRKESRTARKSHATRLNSSHGNGSSNDINSPTGTAPANAPVTSPVGNAPAIATTPAGGVHADNLRPAPRSRHSYAPGYVGSDNHSPTSKVAHVSSSSNNNTENTLQQQQQLHQPNGMMRPYSSSSNNHLQVPQTHYLAAKESEIAAAFESPSFATSQYEQPRLRKPGNNSGNISVDSSINLEASSPFLRDDDKRSSRSSRFFAKVRKSMPFLKTRRSQVLDDIPPMEQSQMPVGNRNRVSFFQSPFRRFSMAPSAVSLNNPSSKRVPSYYPPAQPLPPPPPPPLNQPPQLQQQDVGSRPATAHPMLRPGSSASSEQQDAANGHRRHTDFGPVKQQHSNTRLHTADSASHSRRSEPLQEAPLSANGNANGIGNTNANANANANGNGGHSKRTPRPLSVVSSRQLTPLRLHPTQSHQGSANTTPFSPQKAGTPLPPAITSRASTPNGATSGSSKGSKPTGLRGMFNLRYTMLGPLQEIHYKLERALKNRSTAFNQMTNYVYFCEEKTNAGSNSKNNGSEKNLRFEIHIEVVQGQLHTIRFKRIDGSWWSYKRLTVAITDELQGSQRSAISPS